MANVLIGIIGVILFIGLALAGASFLGPRFNEAQANTKASQISEAISQSVAAYKLRKAQTGAGVKVGYWTDLTNEGYMKDRPLNVFVRGDNGDITGGVETKFMLVSSFAEPSTASDSACVSFARLTDMSTANTVQTLAGPPANKRAGCFKASAAWGDQPAGTLIYFHRV
jgi:hypothetical protein